MPAVSRIVVGVDGSEPARQALAWAADEAALRRADLEVVCAFGLASGWLGVGEAVGGVGGTQPPTDELRKAAHEVLGTAVDGCPGLAGVTVHTVVADGRPADLLVERSRGADLLVVGTRGHAGLGAVVLGSTSLHCVEHAWCPVVVVRPGEGGHDHR